jgi:putative membrane protein
MADARRLTSRAVGRGYEVVGPWRQTAPRLGDRPRHRALPERLALGTLAVFTAAALVGFAVFGRHPQLLARFPGAEPVYLVAFAFFARAQVALAFLALAVALSRAAGTRWLPALAALYALSLASELLGTTVGLPFGPYRYTDGLGPKWFGHVPLLIPLSWFTMAVPALALALPARRRLVLGALGLLAWDLALDPAMSGITTYWVWGGRGPYYGMPWLNLVGWFVTGLALMAALLRLGADAWLARLDRRWTAALYAVNLAMPLGMCAAAGYWGAVLATLAALAALWLCTLASPRRPA